MNNTQKEIWTNSYPVFLWLVLEPIVGLIDSKIASLIGITTLSSIGIAETIYFVFIWIFIFLAYGTTPFVASLKTKGEVNNLNYFIKFGRNTSLALGIISILVLILSSNYLISIFNPTDDIFTLSKNYLVFRCIGIPFYLLNMHSTAVLRGLKVPNITFQSAAIVALLNIFFSYMFGISLNFGASGIGFASTVSFLFASLFSSYKLTRHRLKLAKSTESVEKKQLKKKFFQVGFLILIRSFFLTIFMAYLRNKASLMSMEEIALQHLLLQFWSFGYIFVDAVAIASQALVAELISKKNNFQSSSLQKELIKLTLKISIFLFIFSFTFLERFVRIFDSNNLMEYTTIEIRILFSISLLIGSFAFLWDGVLLGLDKSKQFSLITIFSSLIGFLFCSIFLLRNENLGSLWLALDLSLISRAVLGYFFQRSSYSTAFNTGLSK
jgi:MATE family multidrug resistance protein